MSITFATPIFTFEREVVPEIEHPDPHVIQHFMVGARELV